MRFIALYRVAQKSDYWPTRVTMGAVYLTR